MKRKIRTIALVALMVISLSLLSAAKSSQDQTERAESASLQHPPFDEFNPDEIADGIINGLISEKQFRRKTLSDEQVVDVFKKLREKRGWNMDDDLFTDIATQRGRLPDIESNAVTVQAGGCDQPIELQSGTRNYRYYSGQRRARAGECGSDPVLPDIVLLFSKPITPRTSPNNFKWWSNAWYVRWVLNAAYGGRLAASGLCGNQVRVCVGARGYSLLGPWDFSTIYIWWNQ